MSVDDAAADAEVRQHAFERRRGLADRLLVRRIAFRRLGGGEQRQVGQLEPVALARRMARGRTRPLLRLGGRLGRILFFFGFRLGFGSVRRVHRLAEPRLEAGRVRFRRRRPLPRQTCRAQCQQAAQPAFEGQHAVIEQSQGDKGAPLEQSGRLVVERVIGARFARAEAAGKGECQAGGDAGERGDHDPARPGKRRTDEVNR